jgi:cytochrome c-type biogenesis protein CcmH
MVKKTLRVNRQEMGDASQLRQAGFSWQGTWSKFFFGLALFLCGMLAIAQTQSVVAVTFASPVQQQQFKAITEELRCLVCQNESLWDSTAPLAQDLRNEIAKKITKGASNAEIKQYLVARYGEFILFKPTLNQATYILWIMPFVLLVLGFFIVVLRAKRTVK